jgi:hypothetical protein
LDSARPIRRVVADRRGRVRITMPRPAPGRPFAVYRLMTRNGRITSEPILVRASR